MYRAGYQGHILWDKTHSHTGLKVDRTQNVVGSYIGQHTRDQGQINAGDYQGRSPWGSQARGGPRLWQTQERAKKIIYLKNIYIIIKEIYYVSIIYFNITYQGYLALTLRGPEPAGFLFN